MKVVFRARAGVSDSLNFALAHLFAHFILYFSASPNSFYALFYTFTSAFANLLARFAPVLTTTIFGISTLFLFKFVLAHLLTHLCLQILQETTQVITSLTQDEALSYRNLLYTKSFSKQLFLRHSRPKQENVDDTG